MSECSVRVFKNTWFDRFARKQRISDAVLLEAVERADSGLVDADLGGGVIKQRLAREGQGKSVGFRSIILYRKAERAFLVYGFAKSDRDNIDEDENAFFRKAAIHVLKLSENELDRLIESNEFKEVS
jgi:hypothetical protein